MPILARLFLRGYSFHYRLGRSLFETGRRLPVLLALEAVAQPDRDAVDGHVCKRQLEDGGGDMRLLYREIAAHALERRREQVLGETE